MRVSATRIVMIASVMAGLAGCQSGPRWAWWKTSATPSETAQAASSRPELPSAAATPKAVAATEPTPSPSATNLAVAGTTDGTLPAVPPLAVPSSSAATIANAPLASYPAATSAASGAASTPLAQSPTVASPTPPAGPAALATVPPGSPAGPYDPNAYRPSNSLAGSAASATAAGSTEVDRYAIPDATAITSAATNYSPSAAAPSAAASPTSNDPYAVAAASVPTAPTAPSSVAPSVDPYGPTINPNLTAATPSGATSVTATPSPAPAPAPAAAAPATTVQLTSAPGQYRPGGTSSYTLTPSGDGVQIATRPDVPATTTSPNASAPADPWAPPASSTPAAGATRTY